jgi:ferrous iron transport protein B
VVQVGDAKNMARTLLLTLQFAELKIPLVLDLNMADEARQRGVTISWERLSEMLGVEVVPTVATRGTGVDALRGSLGSARIPALTTDYGEALEEAIREVEGLLPEERSGKRGLAVMLLTGDPDLEASLSLSAAAREQIRLARERAQSLLGRPVAQVVTQKRWEAVDAALAEVYRKDANYRPSIAERVGRWAVHPVAGWPILVLVLYLVYKFVGEFGAGTLVNLFEGTLLGQWVIPALASGFDALVPVPLAHDFMFGDFGLVTMGLGYGFGIVLPIVSTFFLAFGLLEDSGYLPRLAVMVNRAFKVIGLNGKAVLPLVLGLGCVTMATMTTRILSTRKERLIATILLALSIPCSAQLGVILGMVGWLTPGAVFVWVAVVVGVMLAIGWLASKAIPGERSDLILEMPPLRPPQLDNIATKTVARVEWYLKEVIPLFVLATGLLFVLSKTGLLSSIEQVASPLVSGWLGLPPETTGIFLVGFLRRDYGAAGLFALAMQGLLTPHQVLVSLVVITLFVPCVATVMMIVKEQGGRKALAIVGFVFPFAFLVGGLVHRLAGG